MHKEEHFELLGLAASQLNLKGSFWVSVLQLNMNTIGYVIVCTFVATSGIALLVWRFARSEERWSANVREPIAS